MPHSISKLFDSNRDIVVNSDIDGMLCAFLLCKYLDCRVVGFSDSKKKIWLTPEVKDVVTPVYVDLYISNPQVKCIDQHIVSIDTAHGEELKSYDTKLNPNLMRNRALRSNYRYKYPFGTVHFIMALLAAEGIDVVLPDLSATATVGDTTISFGELILRADDALYSSLGSYRQNAIDWWNWLHGLSINAAAITSLMDFVEATPQHKSEAIKQRTGSWFKSLGCNGSDGGIYDICNKSGWISTSTMSLISQLEKFFGYTIGIPAKFVTHAGFYGIQNVNGLDDGELRQKLQNTNLFSYAFIFGDKSTKTEFQFYNIDKITSSNMLKPILSTLLVAIVGSLWPVWAAGSYHRLSVVQTDGTSVEVNLSDEFEAKFSEGNLIITGAPSEITIPVNKMKSWAFTSMSAIETVASDPTGMDMSLNGKTLTLSNLPSSGCEITVYDAQGRLHVKKSEKSTTSILNLNHLETGVYFVSNGKSAFKFIIK